MDCTQTRKLLHAYLDHELDAANALVLDAHAESCPTCKTALAQQSVLKSALRKHAAYHTAPAGLADRIHSRLPKGATANAKQTTWLRWLQPRGWLPLGAAVAATAVVTWIAALQVNTLSRDDLLADQVISGYARSVVTEHVTDVASSDQHTVKPWISSRLDFSPPVPDLASAGFPLVGGRLDYIDNRSVAALVYHRRQHVIDLFVWPGATSPTALLRATSRQGYHLLHWADGDMTYWAISDVNPDDLKLFVDAYRAAK